MTCWLRNLLLRDDVAGQITPLVIAKEFACVATQRAELGAFQLNLLRSPVKVEIHASAAKAALVLWPLRHD